MHRRFANTTLPIYLCLLLLLTGCGSDSEETAPEATPTSVAQATDTLEPTAEPAELATPTPEAVEEPKQIIELLSSVSGFEHFVDAVANADLTEKLESEGPFTVFVPTNKAFEKLPPGALDDPHTLQDIMLLHVVVDEVNVDTLIAERDVTSLLGDDLTTLLAAEGATVNGANVLAVDIGATNGLIHILDTVMLPTSLQDEIMSLYPSVADEETYPMQGNLHIDRSERSPVAYNSTPPTSGPHFANIVAWQVYDEPIVYEHLVHNLEDGGVVIYYQCEEACPEIVDQLTALVQPLIDDGRHIVLVPNEPGWTHPAISSSHGDIDATIAVTAWQKLLKLDEFDQEKIEAFIESYEGIDHHVRYN